VAFVLIIDASQTHATRASDVLTAAGHACGYVNGAEQAIALLRWRVPDLVLLDQAIPGADGGTLPHKLRRIAGVVDLPIILLTTDSPAASLGEIGNAVLDDIRKPFDPGFLAWRVNHAIEAHRTASEPDEAADDEPTPALRSLA
jgi:two-component system, OmpR family, phosphate regulon response regulator PhoB